MKLGIVFHQRMWGKGARGEAPLLQALYCLVRLPLIRDFPSAGAFLGTPSKKGTQETELTLVKTTKHPKAQMLLLAEGSQELLYSLGWAKCTRKSTPMSNNLTLAQCHNCEAKLKSQAENQPSAQKRCHPKKGQLLFLVLQ